MKHSGPVIFIDDDPDDHAICEEILKEIGVKNPIICFHRCEDVLEYLARETDSQPYIIICDINIPRLNGIQLKKLIDESPELKKKSIPFVHYSTSGNQSLVERAFENNIQGFFVKETSVEGIKSVFRRIFDYWGTSLHPKG